jgi:hypothetical protein
MQKYEAHELTAVDTLEERPAKTRRRSTGLPPEPAQPPVALYTHELGSQASSDAEEFGVTLSLMLRLLDPLPRGPPYHLVHDRFYTSVFTARYLHKHLGIFSTGTILPDRGVPKELVAAKLTNPGEFTAYYGHPRIGLVKWKDTRDVYLLSTAVSPTELGTIRKRTRGMQAQAVLPAPLVAQVYHAIS